MDERFRTNKFYLQLWRKAEQTINECVRKNRFEIVKKIESVEAKLEDLEKSFRETAAQKKAHIDNEIAVAEGLVNRELKTKIIMSDWTGHFLTESQQDALDPLTFAFSRYSLSVALCYADISSEYVVRTNAHKQLVDYIQFESDLVVGPALMALAHLTLHEDLQPLIVLAGALPPLCKILAKSTSKPALCHAAKLCMGLARHFPNKSLIVNSGCLHGVLDLVLGTKREIDDNVQCAALGAVANICKGNDASRTLTVELDGIRPIITAIQTANKDVAILRALKAIGNVGFCSSFTASSILKAGGHLVLLEVLQVTDILRQPRMAEAALVALSNLCNNEQCQTHLASAPGLCVTAVRICEHARVPYLAAEAATLLLAIMWRNYVSKARVGTTKGACSVLMKRLIRHSAHDDPENVHCAERMAFAVASLMLHDHMQEQMHDINGFEEAAEICKKYKNDRVLKAVGQILVAMQPSPDYLAQCHDDSYVLPVEKIDILPVLKKVKYTGFWDAKVTPEWLEKAMRHLGMDDDTLRKQPRWAKDEFVDRMTFAREFLVDVDPDAAVFRDVNLKGLLLSTF